MRPYPIVRFLSAALFISMLLTGAVSAQTTERHSGRLDESTPEVAYTFILQAGESVVISAEALSGILDTVLALYDPNDKLVSQNDDRNAFSFDSALGFTAELAGTYRVTVSRYDYGDTGGYSLTIETGDESILRQLKALSKVAFTGPERVIDTLHFRVHYTLEGGDATTSAYAQAVADTMEEIWQIQIDQIGWPSPPDDGEQGGNSRLDVYLMDLMDDTGDGPLGTTKGIGDFGDNPHTTAPEEYAISSVIRIESDFAETTQDGTEAIGLMRATAAHEFHHAIQHGYDYGDTHLWYHEATSTWMETITFPKDQDATGYVDYNYRYPELCFGTETDPEGGMLVYGDWLFMQSLVDVYGSTIIRRLWETLAVDEGFAALENVLRQHSDTVPAALARYRIQNLVRSYKFAPDFEEATVWLEGRITGMGRWDYTGMQELGANYLALVVPPGTYQVRLADDTSGMLQVWAVSVTGNQAASSLLGRAGLVATGAPYTYLVVFNTAYDEEVNDCSYQPYTLEISAAAGTPAPVNRVWDAKYFLPLK
jgi:hypothetical protein